MSACKPETAHDVTQPQGVGRTVVGIALTLPAVAVLIVILFLTMGQAHLSNLGIRLLSSFIFTICIGLPSAIALTWMSFRWVDRIGKWLFPVYIVVLLFMAVLGSLLASSILQWTGIIPPHAAIVAFRESLPFTIVITLMVGLSMCTYTMLRYQLNAATLELKTQQMEQERSAKLLAEARLSSLESRIHPHFLFNTLNSIAALIPRDPQRAEDTVSRLASLLRFSLTTHATGLAPLSQELKVVRDYLDIESTRFGARLRYQIDTPDSLDGLKAPPLAVQTLVENAVKHVVAQRAEGASLKVVARREGDQVRIEVADDGPGFTLDAITPEHGLGNLVARLDYLFGEKGQLDVARRDGWTVVSLSFPAEPQA